MAEASCAQHTSLARRGISPVGTAPMLRMRMLALLLAVALPSSMAACADPFTYTYNKIKYDNAEESGRSYTLYDIYPGGCLWNFTTAKAICEQDGLQLAPHGEAQSLAVLRELCAKNRYTCWMDGVPADPSSDLCYLMSQEGDVHLQGCDQPVRFVCRQRAAAGRAAARGVAVPTEGVLSLSSHDYDYRLYTVDAAVRMSYHGAVEFCQELGAGWDLVPYWDDSSNAYAAVLQLCSDLQFTCWLKRKDDSRTGSSGPMLCPLMAADGGLQMQGCEQDVRFVCRKAQRAT